MKVTEDGIFICVSDEHPLKALSPIDVTVFGMFICVRDEHPLKAKFSIFDTVGGIFHLDQLFVLFQNVIVLTQHEVFQFLYFCYFQCPLTLSLIFLFAQDLGVYGSI